MTGGLPSVIVSNVLSEEKKQQVIALGRLGWSLRRIQGATRIRRETAASYLKAAGIAIRPPGASGEASQNRPFRGWFRRRTPRQSRWSPLNHSQDAVPLPAP